MISVDEIIKSVKNRIKTAKFTQVKDAIAWMNGNSHTKHFTTSSGDVDAKTGDKKISYTSKETLLLRYLPASIVIAIVHGIVDYSSGDDLRLPQILIGFASFTLCFIIVHNTDSTTRGKRGLLILLEIIIVAGFFFQGSLRGITIFDFLNLAIILAMVTSGREKKGFFLSCLLLVIASAIVEIYDPAWIIKRETKSPVWFGMIELGIRVFTFLYTGYRYFENDNLKTACIDRTLAHAHLEIEAYTRQLKGAVEELLEAKRENEVERARTLECYASLAVAKEAIKGKNEQIRANNQTLERIIQELKIEQEKVLKANGELEALNAELNAKNEFIAAANETLERRVAERTDGMIAMDRKIEQFAFFTSHELRGPLARILGLANLMKIDVTSQDKGAEFIPLYIDKLFFSAVELDIQVRRATGILNEVEIKHTRETELNICANGAGERSPNDKTQKN